MANDTAPTLLQRALDVIDATGVLSALTLKIPMVGETVVTVSIPTHEWARRRDLIAHECRLTLESWEELSEGDGYIRIDTLDGRVIFQPSGASAYRTRIGAPRPEAVA